MNWDNSQMISSAIAQGQGGMSLGEQWALAAMLRGDDAPRPKEQRAASSEEDDE